MLWWFWKHPLSTSSSEKSPVDHQPFSCHCPPPRAVFPCFPSPWDTGHIKCDWEERDVQEMYWCRGAIKSDDPAKAGVQVSSSFCIKIPLSLVCRSKVLCTQKPCMDIRILGLPPSYLWTGVLGDHTPSHPVPGMVHRLVHHPAHLELRRKMQHFTSAVPENILCFHNSSSPTAFHVACPVSALSPSRSTIKEHHKGWLKTTRSPLRAVR